MEAIRQMAIHDNQSNPVIFGLQDMRLALKKYKKNTKGADLWTKDELTALPNVVLGEISDACKISLDCATVPIQNLASLNVCLGKEKGHRTIVKTPMIYRLINKIRSEVSKWEADT